MHKILNFTLGLTLIIIAFMVFTLQFNPMGLSQRLFWDMEPPYHWVSEDLDPNIHAAGSLNESYIGVNGKACATVYRWYRIDRTYTVFGYGFSEHDVVTQKAAEQIAENECK